MPQRTAAGGIRIRHSFNISAGITKGRWNITLTNELSTHKRVQTRRILKWSPLENQIFRCWTQTLFWMTPCVKKAMVTSNLASHTFSNTQTHTKKIHFSNSYERVENDVKIPWSICLRWNAFDCLKWAPMSKTMPLYFINRGDAEVKIAIFARKTQLLILFILDS